MEPLFTSVVEDLISGQSDADSKKLVDSKSLLQQWVFGNISPIPPKYFLVKEAGPAHAKEYTVEVRVGDQKYGEGLGSSKKEAEKCAAEDALAKLKRQGLM